MPYNPGSFTSAASLPTQESLYDKLVQAMSQGYGAAQAPQRDQLQNQLAEAQIGAQQSQGALNTQKAQQQQMVMDYLKKALAGGGNAQAAPGGGADMADQYMRKLAGLPDETPHEKMQRELATAKLKSEQSRNVDRELGTTANITELEKQLQGIENTLPELESHIKKTIPWNIWTPWTTGKESEYKTSATRVGENYMNAMNWPSGEGSRKEAISMFEKPTGNWDSSHIKRLKGIHDSLLEKRERILEQLGRKEKKEQKYADEDIDFTAKKYGISREEVLKRLGQG